MSFEIIPDYSQRFVLPPSLEDWLPQDHYVRFIRGFVDDLDLESLGFTSRKCEDGRPNYSSNILLKVWLYGYFEKIYSSRALEKLCRKDLALIWMTGMNYPDHNTIWRFFKHNQKVLKHVFSKSVQLAIKGKLVSMVLQAVDGTKIFADVSKNRTVYFKDLKKLLTILDSSLDEVFENISSREKAESEEGSLSLPPEFQDKRKLNQFIHKGLDELNRNEKQELRRGVQAEINRLSDEGVNQMNLTDRDARQMKVSNGSSAFCYNAQVVVDAESQIIVGAKVSTACIDNHLLTEMIEEAAVNTGQVSQETLADGGYFSGEELQQAEDKGYSVLVNMRDEIRGEVKNEEAQISEENDSDSEGEVLNFRKRAFTYDESKDVYICPAGKALTFERVLKRNSKPYPVRIFRCRHHKGCKYKELCSRDKIGRGIERSPYEKVIENQINKQADAVQRRRLRKRKEIVEPVFGWIKRNNKFFRWSYCGLESVAAQWQLICAAINLRRLYCRGLLGAFDLQEALENTG